MPNDTSSIDKESNSILLSHEKIAILVFVISMEQLKQDQCYFNPKACLVTTALKKVLILLSKIVPKIAPKIGSKICLEKVSHKI